MARKTFNSNYFQGKRTKKIIVRFSCEGKTEVNYFEALNQTSLSERFSFKACFDKSKNRAHQVAERLFEYWSDIDYEKDLLFAVYDKDENSLSQHEKAKQIVNDKIKQFKNKEISINAQIIFSNPCFEIWIYFHFQNDNTTLSAQELKGYCKKLQSNYIDFPKQFMQKLEQNRERAVKHSKLRLIELDRDDMDTFPINSRPNTNIHLVFDKLI